MDVASTASSEQSLETILHQSTAKNYSNMCGHFLLTIFRSNVRCSKNESVPAKAFDAPPPYHYTPTHARIDSIMGVPSSYSIHDRAAAVKEADEKRRSVSSLYDNASSTHINAYSRNNSCNSLDQITIGRPRMARKPSNDRLYPRPRQQERRRPPSSPLANLGMSTDG